MKILPLAVLGLVASAGPLAYAETIVVDDKVAVRETTVQMPVRGASMKAVESQFGAPSNRHAAVGKPPITRWDYPGFAVFFEHEHVVHSVAVAP
jgi:hypothetical protein